MKRALSSKNKLKFMMSVLPQPTKYDPNFKAWKRCNNIVISWITRERFNKVNHFWISNLLQELHSMKQGDRSLSTYFTNLKFLWDELEHLRSIPSCTCLVSCICNLSKYVKTYKQIEYVILFLKGLNDGDNHVKTQILLMDPLPSFNKAFALAI
ncbi:hypothetical protein CR513_10449, partial [Mucuna pruriens]